MKPVTVSTVLHAGIVPFIPDFIASLNAQTFRDFSAVFVVDGIPDVRTILKDARFDFDIVAHSGTPAGNRYVSIQTLKDVSPSCIVFCDGDDVQQPDHIRRSVDALEQAAVVCNDIDIVDQALTPNMVSFWGERLADNFVFSCDFLADKNIVGLGNSAVRGELLSRPLIMPQDTPAPDWLLFAQWLDGNNGIFLHRGKTLYRQHEGNLIGLKKPDLNRLDKVIQVKLFHYNTLQTSGIQAATATSQLAAVKKVAAASRQEKEEYLQLLHRQQLNYFWWEETNFWK